jgi:cytochrome c biogenesis protein CcdA
VLRALLVVAGIAIVDSLNPSTIGPAIVLATSQHGSRRVLEFAAGAFLANMIGGALLILGPGHWLLGLLPHPSDHAKHIAEVAAGALLLIASGFAWFHRRRFEGRALPGTKSQQGAAFTVGLTVQLVEFPTAFPYFAAIAAIVGLDVNIAVSLSYLALFNVLFLTPLVIMAIAIRISSGLRESVIAPAGRWLDRQWPTLFASVLTLVGAALLVVGCVGLAR